MNILIIYIGTIVFILLIVLSIFFSSGETALTSLSKFDIKELLRKKSKKAGPLKFWLERPNRLLTAILIGNNFVNICASILATLLAINISKYFHLKQTLVVGLTAGLVTIIVLVFGEITPKTFAKQNAKRVSLFFIRPLLVFAKVISPIIKVLVTIANLFTRMLGGKTSPEIPIFTEDEIRTIIDISEEEGTIEKEEREMLKDVLEFGDTIVREVMVPRIDMHCIDINTTSEKIINEAIKFGHSRFPVYRDNLDDVVGVLYSKDILRTLGKNELLSIENLMRQCVFVPETKKISGLLKEFRNGKMHLAVVVDEYGVTSGLITIEDLLEEITGEIKDEYDVEEENIKQMKDGSIIVSAKENLDKVAEVVELELPSENFDSIGGLVIDLFGRIPKKGEEIIYKNLKFIVEDANRKRIIKIKIIKK